MASVYKWKIGENPTVYAYICSPDSDSPMTSSTSVDESRIAARVPNNETAYCNAFNAMVTLMQQEGYSNAASNLAACSTYFNTDDSACLDPEREGGSCPEINLVAKTIDPSMEAYACLTDKSTKPDGTNVYFYELGIPQGWRGVQGEQGIQGPAGSQGRVGPQGEQGMPGVQGERGTDGVDAEAAYISFIFTKSNRINAGNAETYKEDLDRCQPDNGTGTNPYYNDPMRGLASAMIPWSDTVPQADEDGNEKAMTWMSKKTFTTADNWATYTWSVPVCVADSDTMDYEWNKMETDATGRILTLEDMQTTYAPTRTTPDDTGHVSPDANGWYDDPISGAVWMAVREIKNGEYVGDWKISKIKGEDGDNGEPIKLGEAWDGDDFYEPGINDEDNHTYHGSKCEAARSGCGRGIEMYEAHVCQKDDTFSSGVTYQNGGLYVWDGDNWKFAGKFEGTASYIHIKYANRAEQGDYDDDNWIDYLQEWIEWTDESGETPNGTFIGLKIDDQEEDYWTEDGYKEYKWSQNKGEDGFGYEYIYVNMDTYNAPLLPTGGTEYRIGNDGVPHVEEWDVNSRAYQKYFDFIPIGVNVEGHVVTDPHIEWTDDFISPSPSYPYVYEAYRRREPDGTWGPFRGDGQYAALKAIYAESPDYRSTIFKRSNAMFLDDSLVEAEWTDMVNACADDSGGTYERPVPTVPDGWYDGIPTNSDEVLWMSSRMMSKKADLAHVAVKGSDYSWSRPVVAADGEDIDREWCSGYTEDEYTYYNIPRPERLHPSDTNPGCDPFNPDGHGWFDNPIHNAIWLAECRVVGGEYELDELTGKPNWKISRIKGEDGKSGDNAIIADLTNEMDGVSLGDDLKLDVDPNGEGVKVVDNIPYMPFKTTAYVMSGSTKTRPDEVYVTGYSDGELIETSVTTDRTGIEVTIYVKDKTWFNTNGRKKSYQINVVFGGYEKSITYTIVGVPGGKDGEVYRLITNVDYVAFDQDDEPSVDYVTCEAYLGDEELTPPVFQIYYSTGVTPISTIGGTMHPYPPTASGVPADLQDKGVIFYLVYNFTEGGQQKSVIIDRETVPYVRDGRDGAGVALLEIFNENDSVFLGNDHTLGNDDDVDPDFTGITFTTSMVLFSGTTPLILTSSSTAQETSVCGAKIYAVKDDGTRSGTTEYYNNYSSITNNDKYIRITLKSIEAYNDGQRIYDDCLLILQVSIPKDFCFRDILEYQFDCSLTGRNEDNQIITRSGRYKIYGLEGGKDGMSYKLYPTTGTIKYNPNNRRFEPDTINCYAYNNTTKIDITLSSSTREAYVVWVRSDVAIEPNQFDFDDLGVRGSDWDLLPGDDAGIRPNANDATRGIVFYLISGATTSSQSGGQTTYNPVKTNFKVIDVEPVSLTTNGLNGAGSLVTNLSNDTSTVSLGDNWILNTTVTKHTRITVQSGSTFLNMEEYDINGTKFVHQGAQSVTHTIQDLYDRVINVTVTFGTTETGYDDIYFEVLSGASFENDQTIEFIITPIWQVSGEDTPSESDDEFIQVPAAIFEINGVRGGKDGAEFVLSPSIDVIVYDPNERVFDEEDVTITPYYNNSGILNYIGSGKYFTKAEIYYTVGYVESDIIDILNPSTSAGRPHILWSTTASTVESSVTLCFSGCTGEIGIPSSEDFEGNPKFLVFYLLVWDENGNLIEPLPDRETLPVSKDGRNGAGFVVIDLDNEIEPIGVGEDMILQVNTSAETGVKAFHGVEPAHIVVSSVTFEAYGPASGTTPTDVNGTDYLLKHPSTTNPIIKPVTGGTIGTTQAGGVSYQTTDYLKVTFRLSAETNNITFREVYERRQIRISMTIIDNDGNVYPNVSKVYTIVGLKEGDDGVVFKLLPSVDQLKIYYSGSDSRRDMEPNDVTCTLYGGGQDLGTDGIFVSFEDVMSTPAALNSGLTASYKPWLGRNLHFVEKYDDLVQFMGGVIDIVSAETASHAFLVEHKLVFYYVAYTENNGEYTITAIYDRETLPVLSDGLDGAGSITIDLDNPNDTVSTGENDIFLDEVDDVTGATFGTGVRMFSGTSAVSISSITVTVSGQSPSVNNVIESYDRQTHIDADITTRISGANNEYGEVSIFMPKGFVFNPVLHYALKITARSTEGIERSATYTLTGMHNGTDGSSYRLVLNPNTVSYDGDGHLIGAESGVVTVTCTAWFGNTRLEGDVDYQVWYEFTHGQANMTIGRTMLPATYDTNNKIWYFNISQNDNIRDEKAIVYLKYSGNSTNYVDFDDLPLNYDGYDARSLKAIPETSVVPVGSDGILDLPNPSVPYPVEVELKLEVGKEVVQILSEEISGITIPSRLQNFITTTITPGTPQHPNAIIKFKLADKTDLNDAAVFEITVEHNGIGYTTYCNIIGNKSASDPYIYTVDPEHYLVAVDSSGRAVSANTINARVMLASAKEMVDLDGITNVSAGSLFSSVTVDYDASGACEIEFVIAAGTLISPNPYPVTITSMYKDVLYRATMYIDAETGGKGDDGKPGKMLYPAGEWNSATTYCVTDTTAPYVHHTAVAWPSACGGPGSQQTYEYWYLDIEDENCTNCVDANGCVRGLSCEPGVSCCWKPMASFNAIYTDIIIANYGKLGGAIFYENFMFSEYGYYNWRFLDYWAKYVGKKTGDEMLAILDNYNKNNIEELDNWNIILCTENSSDNPASYTSGVTYYWKRGEQARFERVQSNPKTTQGQVSDYKCYYDGTTDIWFNIMTNSGSTNIPFLVPQFTGYIHFLHRVRVVGEMLNPNNVTIQQILEESEFVPFFMVNLKNGDMLDTNGYFKNVTIDYSSINNADINTATIKNALISGATMSGASIQLATITGHMRIPYKFVADCVYEYYGSGSDKKYYYMPPSQYIVSDYRNHPAAGRGMNGPADFRLPLASEELNGVSYDIIVAPPADSTNQNQNLMVTAPVVNQGGEITSKTNIFSYATQIHMFGDTLYLYAGHYVITCLPLWDNSLTYAWMVTSASGKAQLQYNNGTPGDIVGNYVIGDGINNIVAYTSGNTPSSYEDDTLYIRKD